ncbi:hypothetical protein [Clostridium sp. KNHs214]|uniref:hypothetical protein n=1 Tax=Clostridium sp. KNHs214 TaxID=1540257 RepID=UPI000558C23C|nr:hypothetical protein [Clostridium sp. KNHs214]
MKKFRAVLLTIFIFNISMICFNGKAIAVSNKTKVDSFNIVSKVENSKYKVGANYTVTAKAISTNKPLYRFWMGDLKTGKWTILQDYSENDTITWRPPYAGRFEVSVHVRDKYSKAAYEAVKYKDIDITQSKAVAKEFKISNMDGSEIKNYKVGNEYRVAAKAESDNKAQYRFWMGDLKTGKWTILQDYSENDTIIWRPPYAGRFEVSVHVRDKYSKAAYEAVKYKDIDITQSKAVAKEFKISNMNGSEIKNYKVGNEYRVAAKAESDNKAQYRFWMGDLKTGKWTILQDYSENDTITWRPPYAGRFEVSVHVRDKYSKAAYEAVKYKDIDITQSKAVAKEFKISNMDGSEIKNYKVGNEYRVAAKAESDNKAQYRFWMGDLKTGKWTMLQDYSEKNTIKWIPPYAGKFEVSVHVKDENSNSDYQAVKYIDINVKKSRGVKTTGTLFSIRDENKIGDNKYYLGNLYNITALATSSDKPLYRFWVGNLDTGKWKMIQEYSENNTITWMPSTTGRFEVSVHVRDKNSKELYESVKFNDINVVSKAKSLGRQQSLLQKELVNYLLGNKANRDSVMDRAIQLHSGDESNTCVYFTSEALRRVGLTQLPTWVANTIQLSQKLINYGWAISNDFTKLLPGDICFTEKYTHVYTFVDWIKEGDYEWANIIDNQRSKFNGEPYHRRVINHNTDSFDKFKFFIYKTR